MSYNVEGNLGLFFYPPFLDSSNLANFLARKMFHTEKMVKTRLSSIESQPKKVVFVVVFVVLIIVGHKKPDFKVWSKLGQ